MKKRNFLFVLLSSLVLTLSMAVPVYAQSNGAQGMPKYTGKPSEKKSEEMPPELQGVGIDEKIGEKINLSLLVNNEDGNAVPLSSFFHSHKPVLLSPMYYACPGLCNFHFNGVVEALKKIDWSPSNKFEVIAFSFDAKENSELALKKKQNYMKLYDRPGTESGFHFITANQAAVDQLMQSIGFRFRWNETANEWSHASAAILISPEGKITRYLHGVEFNPGDLKLALNESSEGKVGTLLDKAILYCFKYDQHQSKYGLQVFRVMQLAGAFTVMLLVVWLLPVLYRSRREKV